MLDLGAHRGEFAVAVRERYGCRVVAVEAHPDLAARLPAGPGLDVVQAAVAGAPGVRRLWVARSPEGSSVVADVDHERAVDVPAVTLDALALHAGSGPIALVKLDVEGAEIEILAAVSDETLGRIAQLSVEFHVFAGLIEQQAVEQTLARLGSLGFHGIDLSRNGSDWLLFRPDRCGVGPVAEAWTRYVTRNRRGIGRILARRRRPAGA